MKLYDNYQATQAVFKKVIKDTGKLFMPEAVKKGAEMGVISPRAPHAVTEEYSKADNDTKISFYNVKPILELIEKVGQFNMLPIYTKNNGKFSHVALEVTKESSATGISELSFDQMNYLSSIRPVVMQRFFSNYENMLASYKALQTESNDLKKTLSAVQLEFSEELEHTDLGDKINSQVGYNY